MNAIDAAAERELEAIWQDLEGRRDVSCAVLTGAGDRAFSTGADMKDVGKSGLEYWAEARPNGFGGIAFRRTLDVPLLARVNGYALGGGFEMVLGCDIVIASEKAQFGLPEARVGRMPLDGGMVLLQRKIPHNLAMGVMLSGRRFGAAEMAAFGIVNEVAPHDALDEAVDRWVADIVACAPLSLRAIKQTVNRTGASVAGRGAGAAAAGRHRGARQRGCEARACAPSRKDVHRSGRDDRIGAGKIDRKSLDACRRSSLLRRRRPRRVDPQGLGGAARGDIGRQPPDPEAGRGARTRRSSNGCRPACG